VGAKTININRTGQSNHSEYLLCSPRFSGFKEKFNQSLTNQNSPKTDHRGITGQFSLMTSPMPMRLPNKKSDFATAMGFPGGGNLTGYKNQTVMAKNLQLPHWDSIQSRESQRDSISNKFMTNVRKNIFRSKLKLGFISDRNASNVTFSFSKHFSPRVHTQVRFLNPRDRARPTLTRLWENWTI
jgi:hypothetical protein